MKRLLLAEDNKDTRVFFKRLIHRIFWGDIITVRDGQELIEVLDKEKFDVVLTDINMPRKDGPAALLECKNLGNTPVVLLTAVDEEEMDEISSMLIANGVNVVDCIEKPVTKDSIRNAIGKTCT
jgi:CheY-like chemotaxis protein